MAWRCAECGEHYEDDNPPCRACGHHSFVLASEDDASGGGTGEDFRGFVWTCPECGREHQKNSPPCSRCGNVHLEKREPDYSDLEEPDGAGWFEALELKYALGYVAVVGFALLVVLSLTGVVSVPWLFGPSPPGAPGEADTYENVSLQAVEDAYVEELNDRRAAQGTGSLSVGSSLDGAATAFNQRRVRAAVGEGASPDIGTVIENYEPQCGREVLYDTQTAPAALLFDGERATNASSVAHGLQLVPTDAQSSFLADRYSSIGVDVHVAPDDTVYLTVVVC